MVIKQLQLSFLSVLVISLSFLNSTVLFESLFLFLSLFPLPIPLLYTFSLSLSPSLSSPLSLSPSLPMLIFLDIKPLRVR